MARNEDWWLIALAIIFVFWVFVWKSKGFQDWLKAPIGTGGTGGTTGGAGATATGKVIYAQTGKSCPGEDGSQDIGCGGGNTFSARSDHNDCALTNYEATAIIQLQAGDSCGCGDEFDVKLLGPTHSDNNCCWWLVGAHPDGEVFTGGEGPHPDTDKSCDHGVIKSSIGSIDGKKVGIKGVTWDNGNGTRHMEGWFDITGTGESWEKVVEEDITEWGKTSDPCSSNATETATPSDPIPKSGGGQQVEFRCDCDNAKWLASSVIEIVPGQLASGSGGGTGTGAGSTVPTGSTPPAEDQAASLARAYAAPIINTNKNKSRRPRGAPIPDISRYYFRGPNSITYAKNPRFYRPIRDPFMYTEKERNIPAYSVKNEYYAMLAYNQQKKTVSNFSARNISDVKIAFR